MRISDRGLALIAEFEGFVPYLYNDPQNATVGYGFLVHLGPYHEVRGLCAQCDEWPRKSERSHWLDQARALETLRQKAQTYGDAVERTSRPLNQHEYDALTSLCYNIGPGGYINSSVRVAVNYDGDVCAELNKYIYAGGVALPGLMRRRQAECALFNTPVEGRMYTDKEIDDKIGEALALGVRNQTNLSELANGIHEVSVVNKWPLSLKGLWFVARKAWPF